MKVFWEHGFAAASTADLAHSMGINRYSMYAEFESKHGLYIAALDHYLEHTLPGLVGEILRPDAGYAEIRTVLGRFAAKVREPGVERGCFVVNAATDQAPHDGQTRAVVQRYLATLDAGFEGCFRRAVVAGELPSAFDVAGWSHKLTALLVGILVLDRSGADDVVSRSAAQKALDELSTHRPVQPERARVMGRS